MIKKLSHIIFILIFTSSVQGQYKISYRLGLGIGFTKPDNFNSSLSSIELSKIGSTWFPIHHDLSINIYPSLRIGYKKLSTKLITYNRSSNNYILPIVFHGINIESFFTFRKRLEINFGLSPMLGNAKFINNKLTATDEKLGIESKTTAEIKNSTFGFYSSIGLRMYLMSFLSIDGSVGYIYAKFDEKWKSKANENPISGSIDMTKPFFQISTVVGW